MGVPIPLIPIEVITEILSYLGKNDLLACRLVNQSWNKLSLKFLRNPKYEYDQELTLDNIQKFLEFSNERKEEWILPFHLNFRHGEEEESVVYDQIPKYIQQLQTIFGTQCVIGLTLSHESYLLLESVEVLISIFTLVAPSIIYLNLSEFKLRLQQEELNMIVEEMLGKTQLNFPNLLKLMSCPPPTKLEYLVEMEHDNKIHSFLISNSQNLKELEVISAYELLVFDSKCVNLTKLKIVNELDDLLTILSPIQPCPTPVLKEISFTNSDALPILGHQQLNKFLSSFSTSLQSLRVLFLGVPTRPFPKLDHLRFLQIQVQMPSWMSPTTAKFQVNPEQLNLNSETFPALESMDISTNAYFKFTDASSKDEWIMRTVKSLRIGVMDSPFSAWEMDQIDDQDEDEDEDAEIISAKDYVDHLQELFPNVTSLTLVNESDGHEEYLKQLLIAFIQSDGAPRIQEMEIQNFEKNYLGHILNGLEQDRQPRVIIENMELDAEFLKSIEKAFQGFSGGGHISITKQFEYKNGEERRVTTTCKPPIQLKMTGLEKIRMSLLKNLNPKTRQLLGSEQESNQKDLFLMSLPKHLPLLRQIDISQRMFGEDKDFCEKQIVNVQDKYPNLIINTTH